MGLNRSGADRRADSRLWQGRKRKELIARLQSLRGDLRRVRQRQAWKTYNSGGNSELTDIVPVHYIFMSLDEMVPSPSKCSYNKQIILVEDRAGHDLRYVIDTQKITREIGRQPSERLDTGLRKTVRWYFDNQVWVEKAQRRVQDDGALA